MHLILLFLVIPFYLFVDLLKTTLHHRSLLSIPGPLITRFTKLWYFNRVRLRHFEHDNIQLHEKYGSVVRIAPDHYSIRDRSAVRTVYGKGSRFAKSAWYEGWKHPDPNRWTLFPDRDIRRHGETRKRFASLYSMSSLVHYEAFVDNCADIFAQRLQTHAQSGDPLNLGHWFQCYAFDVIGEITFGERFGFLDQGHDVKGTIAALQGLMTYSTLVGIYPEWHPRLYGTLSWFKLSGAAGRAYIMQFVQDKIRAHAPPSPKQDEAEGGAPKTQDFVEKMMLARDKDPEKVTDYHLYMMGLSNVVAGSDTTAINLSSIMYYLLHNPEVLEKLRGEIASFTAEGRCSPRVTFKESQDMPYLQAVIKEALRMHSATGLPLWRVVPAGGADISGYRFPEGAVVGINTWVAHYNEEVFPEASTFQPERWIEAEQDPERLRLMNDMYMPFGLGSRTCLGKHISILEISKLIPRMVRDFDFTTNANQWSTENSWFVKPTDFEVQVRERLDDKTDVAI
ncbi:cytochrome protein [Aspergillus campestris IBT 28561]|uniref:Cytochrome protein n=1 Tax=Aspergillus campestris (strain IBT 28561) TaxID=1392248 RepID=A0A2I1D8H0_ASPC2|nr:cytochrome protein [Aspergillus campestris IBT 28561]PKY06181.1 cytochrome protein [Aspergillus campestris IBT 28561]